MATTDGGVGNTDLTALSDEKLVELYWTVDADDFAAVEREIASRGAGIVPWVG